MQPTIERRSRFNLREAARGGLDDRISHPVAPRTAPPDSMKLVSTEPSRAVIERDVRFRQREVTFGRELEVDTPLAWVIGRVKDDRTVAERRQTPHDDLGMPIIQRCDDDNGWVIVRHKA